MPNDLIITVRNQAEVDRRLTELGDTLSPTGALADIMQLAVGMLHRYAASIVHVDTGRLKNSLFTEVAQNGNSIIGRVATNVEYAYSEHERGGAHAFFDRTVAEEAQTVNDLFATEIRAHVR